MLIEGYVQQSRIVSRAPPLRKRFSIVRTRCLLVAYDMRTVITCDYNKRHRLQRALFGWQSALTSLLTKETALQATAVDGVGDR